MRAGRIHADHEARAWAAAFSQDYLRVIALSHIHRHTDTCFKYVTNGVFRQPQHCRFGFVHFVELYIKKHFEISGRCRDKVVKHIIVRVGKEPVLPRKALFPEPDLHSDSVVAKPSLFWRKSLGASIETDDRQARRGRVRTVQTNPREGPSLMSGVVGHRGNVDYQNCRRTLVYGYDPTVTDVLRTPSCSTDSASIRMGTTSYLREPPSPQIHSHYVFLSQMLRLTDFTTLKDLSIRFADNVPISSTYDLSWAARRFRYVVIPRQGQSDKLRLRDRKSIGGIPLFTLAFRQPAVDCLVEAIRSGVQTGFYVCDYTTKPNMTCAPLLAHLRDGIQHLSNQMEDESNRRKLKEVLRKGLVEHFGGDASHSVLQVNHVGSAYPAMSNIYNQFHKHFLFPLHGFLFRQGVRCHDNLFMPTYHNRT